MEDILIDTDVVIDYLKSFQKQKSLIKGIDTGEKMNISEAFAETEKYPGYKEIFDENDILSEDDIKSQIEEYEKKFGMSSEEFLRKKREGTAPDTFETMYWMGLLLHLSGGNHSLPPIIF